MAKCLKYNNEEKKEVCVAFRIDACPNCRSKENLALKIIYEHHKFGNIKRAETICLECKQF